MSKKYEHTSAEVDKALRIGSVSNRSKSKRVSSDGVFFRCDNCGFEPQMVSSTDDSFGVPMESLAAISHNGKAYDFGRDVRYSVSCEQTTDKNELSSNLKQHPPELYAML